jgi:hypothetical protein
MLPGHNLSSQQSPKTPEERQEMENIPYIINAVGSLMYLAIMTHPDIAYMLLLVCLHVSIPILEWCTGKQSSMSSAI